MKYSELTPEEKLYDAIFGDTALTWEVHHWLSPEGKEAIHQALNKFQAKHGDRGVSVLGLRFGFEPRTATEKAKTFSPSDTRTLDEVKVYFGVTRERIRQIENKTLRMLRHPAYSRDLKQYLKRLL